MGAQGNQVVVYSMTLDAAEELAMILPIPAVPSSAEDAVKFIDFSDYPGFFSDLDKGFPAQLNFGGPPTDSKRAPGSIAPLKVERVGSFDASFVPTVADFPRLDERFRLPTDVWEGLPQYADYGFVVFKLRAGAAKVHPMSFAFPSRDRSRIVFPTVHIHDGEVHERAKFDHTLYAQEPSEEVRMAWEESASLAAQFINIDKAHSVVRPEHHVYRKRLTGTFENKDFAFGSEHDDGGDGGKNEAA
jgi:hypothetical protein